MKKITLGAVLFGALFLISGCGSVSGQVADKRAIGDPGRKTFQIQVEDEQAIGQHTVWVTVPERVWDRCHLDARYPACAG